MSVAFELKRFFFEGASSPESLKQSRGLSDLHLAVIDNSLEKVRKILKQTADPNLKDHRGWTAKHFAVLINPAIAVELEKYGGVDLPNDDGATPSDFKCYTTRPERVSQAAIPVLYRQRGNDCTDQMTEEFYFTLTSSQYIKEPHVNPLVLVHEWIGEKKDNLFPLFQDFQKKLVEYKSLSKVPHLIQEITTTHQSRFELGLFATKNYEKGEIIGEYLAFEGDINPMSRWMRKDGYNAEKFGNELSRIRDGFLNVVVVPLPACQGRATRLVCVAAEPIKSGEEFFWNSEADLVKLGLFSQPRLHEMKTFLADKNLRHEFAKTIAMLKSPKATFEDYCYSEKLRYIFSSPHTMFFLICDPQLAKKDLPIMLHLAKSLCPADLRVENFFNLALSIRLMIKNNPSLKPKLFDLIEQSMSEKGILRTSHEVSILILKFFKKLDLKRVKA